MHFMLGKTWAPGGGLNGGLFLPRTLQLPHSGGLLMALECLLSSALWPLDVWASKMAQQPQRKIGSVET
jgi:hypothetical protein